MKSLYFFPILLLCLLSSVAFSQTIYMKVADVDGSVTVFGYEKSIELTSAQFGLENSVTVGSGGSGTGKVSVTPITITKRVDISSTRIMARIASGAATRTVEINYLTGPADAPILAYKIELNDVYFTKNSVSIVPNCPNGCSDLAESFNLIYKSIKVTTYTNGQANLAPFSFDVSR